MDFRHSEIKDVFFKTCEKYDMYKVAPAPLLATYDDTVYFASATISGLKSMLLNNNIPKDGVYLCQPCFRLQGMQEPFYDGEKIKYPGYFNMVGMLVPATSIITVQDTIMSVMDDQGISRDRIKVNTTYTEPRLIDRLQKYYEIEYNTRKDKSYNWTYGMGPDIHGTGMTFYIKQNSGEYKRLGQYIIIYYQNTPIAAEYGIGLEVFLARKNNYKNEYDAFAIAPILKQNDLNVNFTNTHILSSAAATYSTGLSFTNTLTNGYKRIISRIIKNLVLLKVLKGVSDEQITNVLHQYFIVEFGDDRPVNSLIRDLRTSEHELELQKNRAKDFIKNARSLNKPDTQIAEKVLKYYPFYSQYINLLQQTQKGRK